MSKARSGRAKNRSAEPSLEVVLNCAYGGMVPMHHHHLSPADAALARRDFESATSLYVTATETAETRAKHGFCLGMLGREAEAEARLTTENVGPHPVARAVLAWVLAGDGGRRLRGFGSKEVQAEREQRRATVEQLLRTALAAERPPSLVFHAAFDVLGTYRDEAMTLADRARRLYPDWGWPHAIFAARSRRDGVFDASVLDALMRTQSTARHAEVFQEAYVYALNLRRFDDAVRVVDTMAPLIAADPQPGDRNVATLAELRAMISLHRGRAGDVQAYRAVTAQMAEFVAVPPHVADGRDPLTVPKFLLEAALGLEQPDAIADAANTLLERCWALDTHERLADWQPMINTPSIQEIFHFGHFDFGFPDAYQRVAECLSGTQQMRWYLLVAADAAANESADVSQVQLLRRADASTGPEWLVRAIYAAFADHEPEDYAGAGAALVQLAERYASWPDDDERWAWVIDAMPPVDMQGSDGVVHMFEGALEWLQRTPWATGKVLLRCWAECVVDNGGKAVLGRIAALSLSRENSFVARSAFAKAQEPDDEPPSEVEAALARYPDPDETHVKPEDLSLLEAACLIALLRACPLDHTRWTLGPLKENGQQRFEPTRKFIGTMFNLMDKGVVAADASTPEGVFTLREGLLYAFLDRVIWRVSAHTLGLQRAIRDLPRQHWPDHWREHAPTLARDLGVEEMVMYLERLLEDRSLPVPDADEMRGIFRVQLEHLAMAQCYYLAYKTMRETLDYQAKHRPGKKQLQSRVINLLRGNGNRAVAMGWDTKYQRVRELPASFLFEALHDVLTGWGTRAFDEPVMALALSDAAASTTNS